MNIEELHLDPRILRAVQEIGFVEPTPIQEQSIPLVKQGKDVLAQSSTGSGKTAAFGLPILEKIQPKKGIQMLVLTPTRELCVQVTDALQDFSKYLGLHITSVYGGVGINPQIDALRNAEVVVATPGRILDHYDRRTINLTQVRFLILDEADKMFEMGFIDDVREIISYLPQERQTLLFSATLPQSILDIVHRHMRDPVSVKTTIQVDPTRLRQVYYNIRNQEKFSLLVHLLRERTEGLALVFCATRQEADVVARNLRTQNIDALAIHGGLTQNKRLHALNSLKEENVRVLVATDVAARGLDIKNVSHVYNYDVPKTPEEYIHRIGRTARAGEEGDAVTLLVERDYDAFDRLMRARLPIMREQPPAFQMVSFQRHQQREGGREGGYGGRGGFRGGRGRRPSRGFRR